MALAPTIHLNGTSGDELLGGYLGAAYALQAAIAALDAIELNGRDYYVQGADAFGRAVAEHATRRASLCAVLSQIEEIAMQVSDANEARKSR